ncbi:MAG: hypothetical protein HYS77_05055, partial [Candidatus Rokubacteria bacterium]|nr:hypothetical protein [Candidatus Rokubacteria bacterium]
GGVAGQTTVGGAGGVGRIRLEASSNTAVLNVGGVTPSVDLASAVTLPTAPTLTITAVAGVAAPAAPGASYATPDVVLPATTTNPVAVAIAAANIPPGTAVTVKVVPRVGTTSSATGSLAGTLAASTATASVTVPTTQPAVLTATATFVLTAAAGGGPVYAEGEDVTHVRVTAAWGGGARVAYVARSGREVPIPAAGH